MSTLLSRVGGMSTFGHASRLVVSIRSQAQHPPQRGPPSGLRTLTDSEHQPDVHHAP